MINTLYSIAKQCKSAVLWLAANDSPHQFAYAGMYPAVVPHVPAPVPEYIPRNSLEYALHEYGYSQSRVQRVHVGHVVTTHEVHLGHGVKAAQIASVAKDVSRAMGVKSIRIVEGGGAGCLSIEVPNATRKPIALHDVTLNDEAMQYALPIALGLDIRGHSVVADLAKMPHVLVAGTTGSGKSVCVNAMICSLLLTKPKDVQFMLIDPKMLELSVYSSIPQLVAPVVTDMDKAEESLTWCVNEMERRYKVMSAAGVRDIAGYNRNNEPLTRIVVVIDELADLMMVAGKKVEILIARIAQKARAAGIHLIVATQRPDAKVVTGLIKANIPTRIGMRVSSEVNSRIILDVGGAESLLGNGDMLYLANGESEPTRVHGALVSDADVAQIVQAMRVGGL